MDCTHVAFPCVCGGALSVDFGRALAANERVLVECRRCGFRYAVGALWRDGVFVRFVVFALPGLGRPV